MLTQQEKTWRETRLDQIEQWERNNPYDDFIDDEQICSILERNQAPEKEQTRAVIAKARDNALSGAILAPEDVAVLAHTQDPELWDEIFETANWIKTTVYGNRIVLFAPLYVSSSCVNNCTYCGFRESNKQVNSRILNMDQVGQEITALVNEGQKRLIAVYGEHPQSDYEYICESVQKMYETKQGNGEIRRVNINAAPLFQEEYKQVHEVGIGTYQVFQETYHQQTFSRVHPKSTLKGSFRWRAFAQHRALEVGLDDVALGVLFGLYDWRYELLGLLYHTMSLEHYFNIGPHTISYPRLRPAVNTPMATSSEYLVSDDDFMKIVAIIRLMCPYTGSILTARETPDLRREVVKKCGVSQMDAGTRVAVGGYVNMCHEHIPDEEQFCIADSRSLDEFIYDLCTEGYLPSFCTAGYREGRTGANFMPLAKTAVVKNYCIANGILTFKEYMLDYASDKVRKIGAEKIIPEYLAWVDENVPHLASRVKEELLREENSERDRHF